MKSDYAQFSDKTTQFIGQQIGSFTIIEVKLLDANTTLICCNTTKTDQGTEHMEAEHWLDENTFHYNSLSFDHDGNFIDSEPARIKPQHMRSFEKIFTSLCNY